MTVRVVNIWNGVFTLASLFEETPCQRHSGAKTCRVNTYYKLYVIICILLTAFVGYCIKHISNLPSLVKCCSFVTSTTAAWRSHSCWEYPTNTVFTRMQGKVLSLYLVQRYATPFEILV